MACCLGVFFGCQERKFGDLDFGRVLSHAIFSLPLASLDSAFDINLVAFRKVFFSNFVRFVANDEVVPFGRGNLFVGLAINVNLICSQRKACDTIASFEIMHFYLIAKMANEHDFV